MSTFVGSTEYVVINCGERNGGCGESFAVTRSLYDHINGTGATWYCPKGHRRHFSGPTDEQKLRDSAAREVALQDQLAASIREGETTRAALLRDRARFAAGVCPCCNRSFENVRRHMTTKHPDYDVARIAHAKAEKTFKCSCGRRFGTYAGLRIHQGRQRETSGDYAWDKPKQSRYWAHLTEVKV